MSRLISFIVAIVAMFAMAMAFKSQAKFVNTAISQQKQQQQLKMDLFATAFDELDNMNIRTDPDIDPAPKCGFCMG